MNVCIKCGQLQLALDVYQEMKKSDCPLNVVTYNTLIDVYGKVGRWEDALKVLDEMQAKVSSCQRGISVALSIIR